MIKFEDLEFKSFPIKNEICDNTFQCVLKLENGYTISIVYGKFIWGLKENIDNQLYNINIWNSCKLFTMETKNKMTKSTMMLIINEISNKQIVKISK